MALLSVVDSSGWLEYFGVGNDGDAFAAAIDAPENLIVPVISIFEVYKRLRPQSGDFDALRAVSVMRLGRVVDLDVDLAIKAADISITRKLPMADSIIYATARRFGAELWTQDADFDGLPGVRYFPKIS